MQQNILIFGANGQVSNELRKICAEEGRSVQIVGRADFDLASEDIREFVKNKRPKAIINASAYTAVDRAESEQDAAFTLNCYAPKQMALAASELGIPFVHFSTDYVFDGSKIGAYNENDQCSPKTVYGLSKVAGESEINNIGCRSTILRTSWVFSEFGTNFVKTMLRIAMEKEEVLVVADQYGRPTWAADCARAALVALDRLSIAPLPSIMHVASLGESSWAGLARETFRLSKFRGGPWARVVDISTSDYPTTATRPCNSVLDTTLIESTLSLKLQPWALGLQQVVSTLIGSKQISVLKTHRTNLRCSQRSPVG